MNTSKMNILLDARINAIISILTRPNQAFRDITENPINYFATAIAILAVTSFFFISYTVGEPDPSLTINEIGYVWDVMHQSESFGKSVLWNLVSIVLIFYLAKRFGGSNDFKKVFSVLAFAMVPVLIGGIILHVFFMYPPLLESITGIDKEDPEFAGLFWPLYYTFMPFTLWSLVLSIKAIKIVNAFGTAKAFGILIASVIVEYGANLAIVLVL